MNINENKQKFKNMLEKELQNSWRDIDADSLSSLVAMSDDVYSSFVKDWGDSSAFYDPTIGVLTHYLPRLEDVANAVSMSAINESCKSGEIYDYLSLPEVLNLPKHWGPCDAMEYGRLVGYINVAIFTYYANCIVKVLRHMGHMGTE